jgi:hypothetical protein
MTAKQQKLASLQNDLKRAYRKWKSAVYFDQFSMIDAKEIADFEYTHDLLINDTYFQELSERLFDSQQRQTFFDGIYQNMSVRCFPKKFKSKLPETSNESVHDGIYSNVPTSTLEIEKFQYFLNLPIEGHIVSVLWILKFGRILDASLDSQCFGNRLRENIINHKDLSVNPYLFYPYFKKYESWRDRAIEITNGLLDLKLNVAMISMDIKGYFYNCRIDFNQLGNKLHELTDKEESQKDLWREFGYLNGFIEQVCLKYFSFFHSEVQNSKSPLPMLPIGFLPSNIISNWYLMDFDEEIKKQLNPAYYGRYVDDILLVFSLNNTTYSDVSTKADFLQLLLKNENKIFGNRGSQEKPEIYITADYLHKSRTELDLSEKKVRVFYFSHEQSRKMLETFKATIKNNSSVFLYLHEDENEIIQELGQDIWSIDYSDSFQKIRSIDDLKISKFNLSKWLAFLMNFSGQLSDDQCKRINRLICETTTGAECLQNFTLWEKFFTIFLKNRQYGEIKELCKKIMKDINEVHTGPEQIKGEVFLIANDEKEILQKTLQDYLVSVLYKVFTLQKNKQISGLIRFLENDLHMKFDFEFREKYLSSFMFNNQIILYPLNNHYESYIRDANADYNLLSLEHDHEYHSTNNLHYLDYFPRYIHFHEIQMLKYGFPHQEPRHLQSEEVFAEINQDFCRINYGKENLHLFSSDVLNVQVVNDKLVKVIVGVNTKKDHLRVGVANVKVDEEGIIKNLKGKSQFYTSVKKILSDIINQAIKEHVDVLVLPECFVHQSWIPKLTKVSRDHQMAMIFGLEHQMKNGFAYNYIVTILPFKVGEFNNCLVETRLKRFYSPRETQIIENLYLKVPTNDSFYTLFEWQGMDFTSYCCYEVCSIEDRALFKSYLDAAFIVECNHDIEYFSNIIESMSRDIHCYCIQVNSSEYGDSRIVQPAKHEIKDIVKAKGGDNAFLIVGTINISEIRDFQLKGYQLQKEQEEKTGKFKPTPPGLDIKKVKDRIG